jgi:hypothetical protein
MGLPNGKHPQMLMIVHPVNFVDPRHGGNLGVDFPPVRTGKGGPIHKIMYIIALYPGPNSIVHVL